MTAKHRRGMKLRQLGAMIEVQNFTDLGAMAKAARLTKGEFLDRLIRRAVERRARKERNGMTYDSER